MQAPSFATRYRFADLKWNVNKLESAMVGETPSLRHLLLSIFRAAQQRDVDIAMGELRRDHGQPAGVRTPEGQR
jgi:hypothetical protein